MSTSPNKEERKMARAKEVLVSDVAKCPITSLDPKHYMEDKRCVCGLTCEWFALCDREALTLMPHPVLGAVPICGPCRSKVEAL